MAMVMATTDDIDSDFNPNFTSCSIESLISVPTEYIFRETQTSAAGGEGERGGGGGGGRRGAVKNGSGGNQKKFIFSKSEVSTLLRVSMLSSELDAMLSLTYDALDRSRKCKEFRGRIIEANKDAMSRDDLRAIHLRALLPILDVHSETAEAALRHATCESFGVSRLLNELEVCAADLRKCAEQNHTMADQLDCYMAPGHSNTLSDEKRAIAEIEEAIAERVEGLSALALGPPSLSGGADAGDPPANSLVSMGKLCKSLFPERRPAASSNAVDVKIISESQMCAATALQSFMNSDSGGK